MTRKNVVPVISAFVLIGFWTLQVIYMQQPRFQINSVNLIRGVPFQFFMPALLMMSAIVAFLLWSLLNQKKADEWVSARTSAEAKKIASSLWKVDDTTVPVSNDFLGVSLRHFTFTNSGLLLVIRPGHPDIQKFRQLEVEDTIEFEPLTKCLECALPHEICGFLRIKAVNNV